jgi:hypothetical protein
MKTPRIAEARLAPITPRTIANVRALEDDLRAGCARGWQYVEGENVPDVSAIATPVNLNGEVYALVVTGPIHRMKSELDRHVRVLLEARGRLEFDGRSTEPPKAGKTVDPGVVFRGYRTGVCPDFRFLRWGKEFTAECAETWRK